MCILSRVGVWIRIPMCSLDGGGVGSNVQLETTLISVELNKKRMLSCTIIPKWGCPVSGFIRFSGLSDQSGSATVIWHRRCLRASHTAPESIRNGARLCHLCRLPSDRRPLCFWGLRFSRPVVVSGLNRCNGKPVSKCKSCRLNWRHRSAQRCRLILEPYCFQKC